MSRAKGRRPGTRGGPSKVLPDDLPDAAEAALDDLIRANAGADDDEPATYSRAVSEARVVDHRSADDDEPATVAGRRLGVGDASGGRRMDTASITGKRKLPPPVAPLASATPSPRTVTYGPLPSDSPLPAPTARSIPLPSGSPLSSPAARSPRRTSVPPERHTPSGRISLPLPPLDTGAVPIVRPAVGSTHDLDPNAIDTNAVPLIDTGLVPLADDDEVDDLGMGAPAFAAGDDVDLGPDVDEDPLAMTGDGHLAEPDMSEVLDALERTTSSRAESMATVDRSRGEPRLRSVRSDDEPLTRPVRSNSSYDDLAFARASSAASVEDDQLVEERAIIEVPALRFAIYEESSHLGSAHSAVAAAGHAVTVAGTGRDGLSRVLDEISEGEVDAVLAAMPGGEPLLEAIAALVDRPVVVASYGSSIPDAIQRAIAAGADLATARPHDLERLAPILLAAARLQLERRVARATRGGQSDDEPRSFVALDAFQRMVDVEIVRARRFDYALSVALFAVEVDLPSPPPGIRGIVRARAGNALIGALRDVDLATQVEPSGTGAGSVQPGNERFLVLLPHTDLKGAAAVARRVIADVTALDPVNAAGRKFAPRIVGAIAGMRAGEPATFDKLVKDATRTLEQARRDGAELAVQP